MKAEGQLRFFQLICIAFAVLLMWIAIDLPIRHPARGQGTVEWLIEFCAIYSAVMGFVVQRRMADDESQPKPSARQSTPLKRWMKGHVIRLSSAASVCVFALVLQLMGGMAWEVFALFGLGMVLLLMWAPGESPARIGVQRAASPSAPVKASSSTAHSATRSSEERAQERRSRAG